MKIEPTHKCFDDAMEMLEAMVKADPKIYFSGEVVLIHGLGLEPISGEPFAHAWLEWGDKAIFRVLCDGVPTDVCGDLVEHRQLLRIYEEIKYTPMEVWWQNRRSGHFGPWHEPFEKFCRSVER